MSRLGQQANYLDGIPVVASSAVRDAMFPSPDTNQRVQNLETAYIERYSGAAWLADAPSARGPRMDVRAFGARGDGVTDDTVAISAAYSAAVVAGGGVVDLSPTLSGYRVATTLVLNGAVPVEFQGPGKIVATTDVKVLQITGSKITLRGVRIERTPASGTQHMVSIEGATDVTLTGCLISGAAKFGVNIDGGSRIKIHQTDVYRAYDHGIYATNGVDNLEIIGGTITQPGFGNAVVGTGKGIGVQGIASLCTNIRILGTTIIDPNQIALELWGASGVDPGVQYFTIDGVIVRQSNASVAQRYGISLDAAKDGTVNGCVVQGTTIDYEVAGGCKRVTYQGCVSTASASAGFQVSNNTGNAANDPDQVTLANCVVKDAVGFGIQVIKAKSININNPQIDGTGDRGLFLNNLGNNSVARVTGGIIQNCAKTGCYLFVNGTTSGQQWDIEGVTALANNTSVAGGEGVGFYVNGDTQAHHAGIRLNRITGSINSSFDLYARTSSLALSASATTSLGLIWQYRKGERWEAVYRIPVQVTGGVAGLTFKVNSIPSGVTGRMRLFGTTSGVTAYSTEQTTTLTSASSTGFLTASFTGFVEITLFVQNGTADGTIDLEFITGGSATGNILTGASVDLVRV